MGKSKGPLKIVRPYVVTDACAHCGYDLQGNMEEGYCPECGWSKSVSRAAWFLKNDELWARVGVNIQLPYLCIHTGEPVHASSKRIKLSLSPGPTLGLCFFPCCLAPPIAVFVWLYWLYCKFWTYGSITYSLSVAARHRWIWRQVLSAVVLVEGYIIMLVGYAMHFAQEAGRRTPATDAQDRVCMILIIGGLIATAIGLTCYILWRDPGLRCDRDWEQYIGRHHRVHGCDPRFIQALRAFAGPPHPIGIGPDAPKHRVSAELRHGNP